MSKMQENAPRVCKNALICALGEQFNKAMVQVFDEIDSTNTEAKRMVLDGFCGDALLVAHSQTAGRGRMGRSFYSPTGTGAYFSILHTLNTPLCDAVAITSASSVAVMRAIRTLTGIQTEIKWVNDLYYNQKKVCGILCESMSIGEERSVVIGIGINLKSAEFPEELSEIAGSLCADEVSSIQMAGEICRELFSFLEDPTAPDWLEDYRKHSLVLGKRITWIEQGIPHVGVAESIREDGALCVRDENGTPLVLRTGEISLRVTQ